MNNPFHPRGVASKPAIGVTSLLIIPFLVFSFISCGGDDFEFDPEVPGRYPYLCTGDDFEFKWTSNKEVTITLKNGETGEILVTASGKTGTVTSTVEEGNTQFWVEGRYGDYSVPLFLPVTLADFPIWADKLSPTGVEGSFVDVVTYSEEIRSKNPREHKPNEAYVTTQREITVTKLLWAIDESMFSERIRTSDVRNSTDYPIALEGFIVDPGEIKEIPGDKAPWDLRVEAEVIPPLTFDGGKPLDLILSYLPSIGTPVFSGEISSDAGVKNVALRHVAHQVIDLRIYCQEL